MRRWFWLTAGLLVWAAHFLGVYLIASASDVWATTDGLTSRVIGLLFSAVCLATVGWVAGLLWRRPALSPLAMWERRVGLTGAMMAGISIVWQTAPLAF